MMEQIDYGQDGLVVLGYHQAMVVKLIGDLLIPLGKVACMFCDVSTGRLINNNLLVLTTQENMGKPFSIKFESFHAMMCVV